jgi:hypothetical protein
MTTKQKFVKICHLIYIGKDGFTFPYEDLDYDDDYALIESVKEYKLIVSKMKNLIDLINNNVDYIYKDIETEIYDLI